MRALTQSEINAVSGGIVPVVVVVVVATPATATAGASFIAWAGLAVATVGAATGIGALGQSMGWWGSSSPSGDSGKTRSNR